MRKGWIWLLLLPVCLFLTSCVGNGTTTGGFDASKYEKAVVKRVVDGDTLLLANDKRVRLIGVNTPETVKPNSPVEAYGKEASEYTKKMLTGKTVYLEKDAGDTDKYGRLLRYVYTEDGKMFNEVLVQEGYAQVMTIQPNVKYQERFVQAQRQAREGKKGLWNK